MLWREGWKRHAMQRTPAKLLRRGGRNGNGGRSISHIPRCRSSNSARRGRGSPRKQQWLRNGYSGLSRCRRRGWAARSPGGAPEASCGHGEIEHSHGQSGESDSTRPVQFQQFYRRPQLFVEESHDSAYLCVAGPRQVADTISTTIGKVFLTN